MAASTGLHTLAVASAVRPLTLEKAKDLAFQLEVPLPVLDNIEARYKGEDRKFHFIQEWLDRDVSASWEKLVSGLEKINMTVLAGEIKANFVEEPQITGSSASGGQLQPTTSHFSPLSSLETVDMPIELTPKCLSAAVFSTANSFTASAPSSTTSTSPPTTAVLLPHPSANVANPADAVSLSTAHSSHTTPSSSTVSASTILPHTPITTAISSTDTQTREPASYSQPSSNTQQPPSFTTTPEPAIVAVAPTPAPTVASATPTQSEPVDQERVVQVKASIERFEDEFSDLFVDAQLSWSEREAREHLFTKRFRAHLLALPVSKKASHIKFFQQHRKEILQANNIDLLCDVLTQYSNYTNYEIIFHLVKKFCREELKTRMIGYRDSFEAFEMATTIDVYLCAISARPQSEIRAGFVNMAMKINKPTSACTLHEIRQLRESIAENASLHSYSMYIENPEEGSVVAAFRVPSHCIWFIARAVTPELTLEQRLSNVSIAGQDLTYWHSNFSRSTWITRAVLMKEYVTDGADGQYLQGRDYHTSSFLSGGAEYTSARDLSTGKMFVIKSTTYDDEEMLEGLTKESDMLSRIPPHKNIVTFIGSMVEETLLENDTVSQRCHLFTELAEHGSLANMIEDAQDGEMGSSMGVDQSLFYLRQILLGVAHLRSLHILHLNINSENILILEGGRRLKLTNFEKALFFEDVSKPGMLPLTGVAPHFVSPEVVRREELSFHSDVWSSVCVFIHLVTGNLPGHRAGLTSRDSMRDMLMKYRDGDIEKLVPLSEMVLDHELVSIFRDTLRDGSRPSALTLLKYPALRNADMYEHNFPALQQREGSEAPLGSELHIAGPSATPVSKSPTTDEEKMVVYKGGQKRLSPVRRRQSQSSRYILQSAEGVEPLKPKTEGPTRKPTKIRHMPREIMLARDSLSRSDTPRQAVFIALSRRAHPKLSYRYRAPQLSLSNHPIPRSRSLTLPRGEELITDSAPAHFQLQPYHRPSLREVLGNASSSIRQHQISSPFQSEVHHIQPITSLYRHPSLHIMEPSFGPDLDVAHGARHRPHRQSVPLLRSQASSSPGESSRTGLVGSDRRHRQLSQPLGHDWRRNSGSPTADQPPLRSLSRCASVTAAGRERSTIPLLSSEEPSYTATDDDGETRTQAGSFESPPTKGRRNSV